MLAAVSTNRRVFAGCLLAGMLCSLAGRYVEKSGMRLPRTVPKVLHWAAWVLTGVAVVFLFWDA